MPQETIKTRIFGKPDATEYPPRAARYLSLIPEGELPAIMILQLNDTLGTLGRIPQTQENFRCSPGKWSVKEIAGHLAEIERSFGFRIQFFATGDGSSLASVDSDTTDHQSYDRISLEELAAEFKYLRLANLALFDRLDEKAWRRKGVVNGAQFSVRALACIIAGHEIHHIGILKHEYLPELENQIE